MHKAVSRALWGAFFVGGLTVLGAGAAHAADTSGEDGVASGNQVGILGEVPVTLVGNAISILGDSESSGTTMAASGSDAPAIASTTSGEDAVLGGNQVMPDVVAPIVASGNAISVIGDSTAEGTHTSAATEGGSDGNIATTTGEDAIASGNQVAPDVDAPITISGNDISVIRDDSVIDDGILDGGLLPDGLLDVGLLDGILDTGIPDSGMVGDPVVSIGIIDDVLLPAPIIDDSLLGEPVAEGRLVGDVDLDVLSPVEGNSAVGNADTATDVGTSVAESGLTPLVATAALTPAMMLAATGVEALPLIGGIAFLLVTGLALVGAKRLGHMIG